MERLPRKYIGDVTGRINYSQLESGYGSDTWWSLMQADGKQSHAPRHHLEKLRLPKIRREWESAAAACLKEGSAYGDLLLRLTESELIECEQRAAERRIKNRQVPCN